MVTAKLRSPRKRASLSQISKRISNTFNAIIQKSGVRHSFFFTHVQLNKKGNLSIELLPMEVLFNVFEFSSDKLAKLCLSNRQMLNCISNYVSSAFFVKRFCQSVNSFAYDDRSLWQFFASSGRLLRVCNIFQSVPKLTNFVVNFFIRTREGVDKDYGWAFLFSEALQNCTQSDYYEFMKRLIRELDLLKASHDVLSSITKLTAEESYLRKQIYAFFLDDCESHSVQLRFRLSAVLRLLCLPKMEYKLLMILGAPVAFDEETEAETIDYESPYIEVINDISVVKAVLGDLPELIEELLYTNDVEVSELRWTEMQVFNLMETVTTYPEPWVLPNFATLLLCSPRLARLAIYTRAIYGSVAEAGYTLFSCVEMAIRLGRDPYLILHLAAREVSARCTVEICVSMFRESIVNAQQRCIEVFSAAAANAPDREFLYETLEVTKQIAVLFQNMLYLIFS